MDALPLEGRSKTRSRRSIFELNEGGKAADDPLNMQLLEKLKLSGEHE
jgi:hypothetical protein